MRRVIAEALAPQAAERKGGRPKKDEETSANLAEVSENPAARETRKVAALGTGFSGSTLDKVEGVVAIAETGKRPPGA